VKAVLSAGGWGTRFYPVAKTICKCMLPVLTKPLIHHVVEECVRAGVREIAVITPRGELGAQVRHYFARDPAAERYFHRRGWTDRYEPVAHLHELADLTFLEQPDDGRYGTALPPLIARRFIGDADFFLINCDDLLLRFDGGSDLADFIAARDSAGVPAVLGTTAVSGERAADHGVVFATGTAPRLLAELRDKPGSLPPGRYEITVGRALLPPDFIAYAERVEPSHRTGEIAVTDAFAAYARSAGLLVHRVEGTYYHCGDVAGWLAANTALAAARDR
jgi:UTP--glucose-1-phosphate uridylyltransferase